VVVRAVARAVGIPWVYEVRGQLADTWASTRGAQATQSERYRLFRDREAEVMRDADLIVTLGTAMKANIVGAGIPEGKILIAPNAVGGDFLEEPSDTASARRELGLKEDGQYIGTVSSLVAYEGLDCLIDAFALLAPRFPQLRLLIVGDGLSRPVLEVQARESGYSERIIFTGRVPREQAARYHQALDVFVVSRKDLEVTRSVTPLKPVEALAENPAALSEALAALLSDDSPRSAMGTSGRAKVLASRTWAANAGALAAAYTELLREK
jgi:glycosyltransferase involved in cell wall biosynthesis